MSRYKLLSALFALDIVLFAVSGLPAVKNAHHGALWIIGGIGWIGGLVGALTLIVLAAVTAVQRARARRVHPT